MPNILVAEDQADIRDLIVLNLQQAGYGVQAVADGQAALASQLERASDLLVLVKRIQEECQKALKSSAVTARFANDSAVGGGGPSKEFASVR